MRRVWDKIVGWMKNGGRNKPDPEPHNLVAASVEARSELPVEINFTVSQDATEPPFIPGEETGADAAITPIEDVTARTNNQGGGNWSDPNTWENDVVPSAGDKVQIRSTDVVTYDYDSMDRLAWLRIDGTLNWDTSAGVTRRMCVGHIVNTSIGTFTIGTSSAPIPQSSTAEIYIADLGDIDIVEDPKLLSRGFINIGTSIIYGHEKTPYVRLAANYSPGAQALTLDEAPTDWEVGDKIVIAGTKHHGWGWNGSANAYRGHEDEVHEIASISGTTLTIVGTLANERRAGVFTDPDGRMPVKTFYPHVANLSRNVRFLTENIDENFPINRRGHIMHMSGTASVDNRHMEIYGFGRTDRRIPTVDTSATPATSTTDNAVGRYAWHCHFMGTSKAKQLTPPIAHTISVWGPEQSVPAEQPNWAGSPGWGLVQHSSGSNWYQNVVYGALGAAFVSEDGSETGTWNENLCIWSSGFAGSLNPKNPENKIDPTMIGVQGTGLFAVGRMIRAKNNRVASTQVGYVLFHRTGVDVTVADHQIPEILLADMRNDQVSAGNDTPPVNHWDDNECYSTKLGLIVVKVGGAVGHEYWTLFDGFITWHCNNGAEFEYTGKYSVLRQRFLGYPSGYAPPYTGYPSGQGLKIGPNAFEFVINDILVEDHGEGIQTTHKLANRLPPDDNDWGYRVVNYNTTNVTTDWDQFDATKGDIEYASVAALPGTSVSPLTVTDYTVVKSYQSFRTTGNISDRFGTRAVDRFDKKNYRDDAVEWLMGKYGYWTEGGSKIVFMPFWQTDQITADHTVTRIKLNVDALNTTGYTNRGEWTAGSPPVRASISANATSATNLVIDVASAASDPDGDTVALLASDRTANAEVIDNGDGTLTYRSDFGFTGVDTFDCWIHDYRGNYVKVPVSVTVT